jgi:hypothetical protein
MNKAEHPSRIPAGSDLNSPRIRREPSILDVRSFRLDPWHQLSVVELGFGFEFVSHILSQTGQWTHMSLNGPLWTLWKNADAGSKMAHLGPKAKAK